jgi:putative acetyltransferase
MAYTIVQTDSENPDFQALVQLLDQDLRIRDGEDHAFYAQYNKVAGIGHVVVCYADGQAVGCGAFKEYAPQVAEIKRMFVLPTQRGRGIAQQVLATLERWAQAEGYASCILETGEKQPEAIRLYEKSGYTRIPNYGQYADVPQSWCFEKHL